MCIDQHSCAQLPWQGNDVTTRQVRARDISEIDSDTTARLRDFDTVLVGLQGANARPQAMGQDFDLLPYLEAPIKQRSGDDGAKASQCEDTIDRQAWTCNILVFL